MDHFLFVNYFVQACQVLEAITACHGVVTTHSSHCLLTLNVRESSSFFITAFVKVYEFLDFKLSPCSICNMFSFG